MDKKTKESKHENSIDKKEKKIKMFEKLPKEISQELLKKIFRCVLVAVVVMLYFMTLNLAYNNIKQERLIEDIKVFSGTFLVIGLIMLEKAYKEEKGTIAISAIECFFLSLHSLSIMHVITLFKYDFQYYLLTSSYIFSIYYILKAIIIYTKGRRDYLKNLSDISDIVKKEKPQKKEAIKTKERLKTKEKENLVEKEKIKEEKKETKKELKKETKKEESKKEETKKETKKRGRPKKHAKTKDDEIEKNTAKRRKV